MRAAPLRVPWQPCQCYGWCSKLPILGHHGTAPLTECQGEAQDSPSQPVMVALRAAERSSRHGTARHPSGRPDPPRPAPPAGPPPSHNPLRPGPSKMAVLGAPRGLAAAASRKRRLLLALALLRPPPAAAVACFAGGAVGSGRRGPRAAPRGVQVCGDARVAGEGLRGRRGLRGMKGGR